jgi:hypothetical protein
MGKDVDIRSNEENPKRSIPNPAASQPETAKSFIFSSSVDSFYESFRKPGLFTSQGCLSGDDVACEGVLQYVEQAARKPMR